MGALPSPPPAGAFIASSVMVLPSTAVTLPITVFDVLAALPPAVLLLPTTFLEQAARETMSMAAAMTDNIFFIMFSLLFDRVFGLIIRVQDKMKLKKMATIYEHRRHGSSFSSPEEQHLREKRPGTSSAPGF
jgi:hypothetical protein